ncbi:hypothetical protein BHM03_00058747 [Ensete ventricosum]|nr:hypothetical protein BHM03_00058747 [Ensete ventricosum]
MQKYRLYLSRLHKQSEDSSSTSPGNMPSDIINNDNAPNFKEVASSTNMQQRTADVGTSENLVQWITAAAADADADADADAKKMVPVQVIESEKGLIGDAPSSQNGKNSVPPLGALFSLEDVTPGAVEEKKAREPTTSKHQTCLQDGAPRMQQFMHYHHPGQGNRGMLDGYSYLSSSDHQVSFNLSDSSSSSSPVVIPSAAVGSEKDVGEMKPAPTTTDQGNAHFAAIPPVASLQIKHGMVQSNQEAGGICKLDGSPNTRGCSIEQAYNQECFPPLVCELGPKSESLPGDLHPCSIQKFGCFEDVGFGGADNFQHIISTPEIVQVQSDWYIGSELISSSDYLYETVDYQLIDERLFA